jgi:sarcosine oxidase
MTFDAIVLGAGVIGASAARALAARGRTLLLERHAFLHDRGSSHGGSRIFRHAYADADHVRLAIAADDAWQALERDAGERLLHRCGGLDFGGPGSPEIAAIEASLVSAGSPVERLAPADVRRRFPAFAIDDDTETLFGASAAVVPATRAVATLLREAAAAGAELRDHEAALAWRSHEGGVEVTTARATYRAERLVIAAGPWLGEVAADLHLPLRIEQQQVLYLRVERDAHLHVPARMPLFIDRRNGIYGFPLFDLPHALKVSDHSGAPAIASADARITLADARTTATVAAARRLLPALAAEVLEAASCLYTKTPDEFFVLDRHPRYEQVVLAGGGSGHAFKFGPLLGEIAADLAHGVRVAQPIAAFAATRRALAAAR